MEVIQYSIFMLHKFTHSSELTYNACKHYSILSFNMWLQHLNLVSIDAIFLNFLFISYTIYSKQDGVVTWNEQHLMNNNWIIYILSQNNLCYQFWFFISKLELCSNSLAIIDLGILFPCSMTPYVILIAWQFSSAMLTKQLIRINKI